MSSLFDVDIKGVPVMKGVNEGNACVRRFLSLSSADTESGVKSAKANIYGKQ